MLKSMSVEKLRAFGVGRRRLDDDLFILDKPPLRLGVFDEDEEDLNHDLVITTCAVPGCKHVSRSLLDFENHYNSVHRYACASCKKELPSPHLLDLHLQETHDSYFAVMAEKKPSYCCYLLECTEKFMTAEERLNHCVEVHNIPRDFRYWTKKNKNKQIASKANKKPEAENVMEIYNTTESTEEQKKIFFKNAKNKTFSYCPKKTFATDQTEKPAASVNMDEIMADLKENLPD